MASLYITEYADVKVIEGGVPLSMGREPFLAKQKITFTGTAGTSAAFNQKTRYVRIHVDGICSIAFGTTATTAYPRMVADQTEYFAVEPAGTVSAITNT